MLFNFVSWCSTHGLVRVRHSFPPPENCVTGSLQGRYAQVWVSKQLRISGEKNNHFFGFKVRWGLVLYIMFYSLNMYKFSSFKNDFGLEDLLRK